MTRTITLHPDALAALAPHAFGTFTPVVWDEGGYLAGWDRTVPGCACLVSVWPENMVNGPHDPSEFTPVGPWSYSGRFDVATAESCPDPDLWTNPDNEDDHRTPHHAFAAALDEHRAVCFEYRLAITQCLNCHNTRQQHGPEGSVFACSDFQPGEQVGRAHWERQREERGLHVPRD
ncbi:hypothetical protein ACFVZ3_14440 [Kitasatospora purpeofusca]|uniref:hypothetical protein n=1 Tax=Kitasatospora purpeofusca TaxID=67352 RepID=UPI0036C62818